MISRELKLPGVLLLQPEFIRDERGYFTTIWTKPELNSLGVAGDVFQDSLSFNTLKGTLRGMHMQLPPFAETKLVRCTSGAVFDVAVDPREDSPTFKHWVGVMLTASNKHCLFIPKGYAHGFITLEDETELHYLLGETYHPEAAKGYRWNDPAFGIEWPMEPVCISERDSAYPLL